MDKITEKDYFCSTTHRTMKDMQSNKPLIYIGNDDGYLAKGIKELQRIAGDYGNVFVGAPQYAQSGKSSAITVERPLRATLVSENGHQTVYKINGTPTDCAKLSFTKLMPAMPDIVLAGINHGYNSGNSALYSGTMGVVFEGSMIEVPSIGFSYGDYTAEADFAPCEATIRKIIEKALEGKFPKGVCLNVNIPKCEELKGMKVTRAAHGRWIKEFDERTDPHGQKYYWLTGSYKNYEPDCDETDLYWIERGYVSVSPCRPDQSATDTFKSIEKILE